MDLNTFAARLFFVLFILIGGFFDLLLNGYRLITPLAVAVLPAETATAQYMSVHVFATWQGDSRQAYFRSEIEYAGHYTTLVTRGAPVPLVNAEEEMNQRYSLGNFLANRPALPRQRPLEPTFTVRYTTLFPAFVVRELPGHWIWGWYADSWTVADFIGCCVLTIAVAAACYFFYCHLRNSRRRYRWS